MKNIRLRLQKYSRWEFRPSYILDIPVYIYWLILSLRAGHLLFFSNINPGMMFSGFAGYGKYDEIMRFDPKLRPKTILVKIGDTFEQVKNQLNEAELIYPMIMKPNLGRTARDIYKIYNEHQLRKKLSSIKEDFVIQEFIEYPLEF